MSNIVEITKGAEDYLGNLLKDSEDKDTNIRIFVSDPGSNRAETCIVYCKPGEQEPTDFSQSYEFFSVFLDEKSLPYLEDAKVDYNPDKFGGQLTIRAPKSKTPFLSDESSIEDKINRFADKSRHQIFVEPEGWDTVEVYVNGFSTSLPEDIQYKALRSVNGFEKVKFFRPGYAIEYDYFPPTQLKNSLETKLVLSLIHI